MKEALEGKPTKQISDYEDRTSEVLYEVDIKASTEIMLFDKVKNEIKLEPSVDSEEVIIDYLNNIKTEVVSGETNKYRDTSEWVIKNEELVLKDEDSDIVEELGGDTKRDMETNESTNPVWFYNDKFRTHNIRIHNETTDLESLVCHHCDYITTDRSDYEKHVLVHGPLRICSLCSRSFSAKTRLDAHIVSNHSTDKVLMATVSRKIYECQDCSYKCVPRSRFLRHTMTHKKLIITDDTNKFDCEHCDYTTNQKHYFNKHLLTHGTVHPFNCTKCSKSFGGKRSLDAHIMRAHFEDKNLIATLAYKLHECHKCSYKSIHLRYVKEHLLKHEKLGSDLTEYSCKQCDFTTNIKSTYKEHVIRHRQKPHFCSCCNQSFNTKYHIDNHIFQQHPLDKQLMATITNKIYACEHCSFRSLSVKNFKNHRLLKHTDDLKSALIKCEQCQYTTYDKGNFSQHLTVHAQNKPHACSACNKAFNSKLNIDSHIIQQHSENQILVASITNKTFECQQCSYKCAGITKFNRHITSNHKNQI